MRDSTVRWLSRLHTTVFRATRGRVGKRLVRNDMLLLTTSGRFSGEPHTVPLLYLSDAHRIVVVASYGGRHDAPDWYENLVADPSVEIELPGGMRRSATARVADDTERAEWWDRAVEAYAGYAEYQERTSREIPIVILET